MSTAFEDHVRAEVVDALERLPQTTAQDVYVVSLLVYDEEDDARRPTLTVGFNTESRARDCTPSASQPPKWPIASDASEARWNYAFWLQNELKVVADTDHDPNGSELRRQWIDSLGLWYSDELEDTDWEATVEPGGRITDEFVALAVRVVQDLHGSGVIERVFGRPTPVLIHELECYEEIAAQNEDANPGELANDFCEWVRGL